MSDITIYHKPDCGTSRNTLGLVRNAGIELTVIEYLKTPPSREALVDLIQRAGLTVRRALREKGTPFMELGLDNTALTDAHLPDAVQGPPILMNRPFVVTPLGVRLCWPSAMRSDKRRVGKACVVAGRSRWSTYQ